MWMLHIAVALHVLSLADTAALAAVQLSGALPALLLMPVAGFAADRLPVRRLALASTVVQAFAVVGMAAAARMGDLVALAGLFAVQGAAMAFWGPSRQQWLYGVVDPALRQRANAAIGSLNGAMIVVGAVGAGAVALWSPTVAIGAAAALFGLGAVPLLRVRAPEPVASATTVRGGLGARLRGFAAGMRDGFTAAGRFPLARSVIWIGIAWGFIGGGYVVMVNGHVVENLGGDAAAVAVVFACDGLAVLAGTVVAGRLPRSAHLPVWATSYVAQGLLWAAFFLAPNLATAVACVVVMRLAGGCIIGLDATILLETVPREYRGRITSVHMATYGAAARLSLAALGAALAVVSLIWLGAAAGLLSALFGVVWWFASGRRSRGGGRGGAGGGGGPAPRGRGPPGGGGGPHPPGGGGGGGGGGGAGPPGRGGGGGPPPPHAGRIDRAVGMTATLRAG
jgi:MFS family permease